MYNEFVFRKDIFLETQHPTAIDSLDGWSPEDQPELYHHQPLSFMSDFHDGEAFARGLLAMRPGKTKLLDLGTATGSCPLTMRRAGMLAVGIDGLDAGKTGKITRDMLRNDLHRSLFAWHVAPELVDCCDITYPFKVADRSGSQVKFDWIISTDCFEHLVEARIPAMLDNVVSHLADDGICIFEVNTGSFYEIHQTVKPIEWWRAMFQSKFKLDEKLTAQDFTYLRSYVHDGEIRYIAGDHVDGYKIILWMRRK